MSLKDALLVPVAFVALLAGIIAVSVGFYGTALCVAAVFAREWPSWPEVFYGVGPLAAGIAILDLLVNHWPGGKMRIRGRKR